MRQLLTSCEGLYQCETVVNAQPVGSLVNSYTYQPACSVVMKIHQGSGILPFLQAVHKEFGDSFPKFNIVTTTSQIQPWPPAHKERVSSVYSFQLSPRRRLTVILADIAKPSPRVVEVCKAVAESETGREFPGSPVIRTPCSHCHGLGSIPGPHRLCSMVKKKKK